jgi:FkbM family methyltransferase
LRAGDRIALEDSLSDKHGFTTEQLRRVQVFAKFRGESVDALVERFGVAELRTCPGSPSKDIPNLMQVRFEDAGVRDGLAYVRYRGRIFYGYLSEKNHRKAYNLVADLMPAGISAENFLVALDVTHRYATNVSWYSDAIMPGAGGTVMEVGAYLGHKTIRFVDDVVGPEGHVLAVEMMPDNCEVLHRNVMENGLGAVIDELAAGVWSSDGQQPVKGAGRQRNTLAELEKLPDSMGISVPTFSLDTLVERWGRPVVDFVLLTVNGAEIEALQGFERTLDRVKVVWVAAPYQRDGRPNSEVCREILRGKGCKELGCSSGRRVVFATPRFAGGFD